MNESQESQESQDIEGPESPESPDHQDLTDHSEHSEDFIEQTAIEEHFKKETIYGAGILPFYVKNVPFGRIPIRTESSASLSSSIPFGERIYFLLGKDPDGKWSDFGGRSEPSDNGHVDITAAREFFEETIGSVMDIQTVLTKLQVKKNHLKIRDKTLNGHPYFMYTIKIPYKDTYRHIFKSTYAFIKYINSNNSRSVNDNPRKKIDYKYQEKIDIQWVSLETLKKSINGEVTEYPLRSIFKRTLEGNLNKIVEFCSSFNDNNSFGSITNTFSDSQHSQLNKYSHLLEC
jgi:hypothetical protein